MKDPAQGITPVVVTIKKLEVYASSFPSNLLIGFKDMSPLSVYPGELTADVSIPDCSKALNEYLQAEEIDEQGVPLVVHTDTLGGIEITEVIADYTTITTNNLIEGQKELEFVGKEKKEVTINIGKGTQIKSLTMDIEGEFAKEMITDSSGDINSNTGIMICPEYTVSQQILLEKELAIVGAELYLTRLTPEAKLTVEIRSGTNQEPSGIILASTEVGVEKNEFTWIAARFAKPITFLIKNNYWIVLKASSGEMEWRTDQNKPYKGSLMLSKDEGVSWTENERMNALFQLVFIPEASISPVELKAGDEKIDLLPIAEAGRITFTAELLGAANKCLKKASDLTIAFSSKASGRLKITNMLLEV